MQRWYLCLGGQYIHPEPPPRLLTTGHILLQHTPRRNSSRKEYHVGITWSSYCYNCVQISCRSTSWYTTCLPRLNFRLYRHLIQDFILNTTSWEIRLNRGRLNSSNSTTCHVVVLDISPHPPPQVESTFLGASGMDFDVQNLNCMWDLSVV